MSGYAAVRSAILGARQPFALCVENSHAGASAILSAAEARAHCVLAPLSRAGELSCVEGLASRVVVQNGQVSVTEIKDQSRRTGGRAWMEECTDGGAGLLTSATTGPTKVVVHSWDGFWRQASETVKQFGRGGRLGFIAPSSIAHAYAINAVFVAAQLGNEVEFPQNQQHLLSLIKRLSEAGVSPVLMGTPRYYAGLCEGLTANGDRVSEASELLAFTAGCSMAKGLWDRLKSFGILARPNYGSTETGTIAADVGETERREWEGVGYTGGTGRVSKLWGSRSSIQLRALDPLSEGAGLAGDHQFEMLVRTEWTGRGYLHGAQIVPFGDQFSTGDVGCLKNGEVVVVARLRKVLLLRDGGSVSPMELEIIGRRVPGVLDIASVVKRDEATNAREGGVVLVGVKPADAVTAVREELAQVLQDRMKHVRLFGLDEMPMSAAGKIIYRELAEMGA